MPSPTYNGRNRILKVWYCEAKWEGESCDREATAAGNTLCNAHYHQRRRGVPFTKPRHRPSKYGETCHFVGCDNRQISLGLCHPHFWMMKNKGVLRPLYENQRRWGQAYLRDSLGRKQCATCKEWKGVTRFGISSRSPDGRRGRCDDCRTELEKTEDKYLNRKAILYNTSVDRLREIYESRDGTCHSCGTPDTITAIHVDHDHACCPGRTSCGECVRGMLCSTCNRILGLARDEVEVLNNLIAYLMETK